MESGKHLRFVSAVELLSEDNSLTTHHFFPNNSSCMQLIP